MIAVMAAAVLLVVNVILTAGSPARTSADGTCSGSPSFVRGHALWSRTDSADGRTTLVHLCVGSDLDPVRDWSVRAGDDTVAVVRLADRLAIAAVPATSHDARLLVEVHTEAGDSLRFRTAMS
jgi:hypothetical protein